MELRVDVLGKGEPTGGRSGGNLDELFPDGVPGGGDSQFVRTFQDKVRHILQLCDVGAGALFFAAESVPELLDCSANFGRIFGDERDLLTIEFDGLTFHMCGDLAVGIGGNSGEFGEAVIGFAEGVEAANEVVGDGTADPEALSAEIRP